MDSFTQIVTEPRIYEQMKAAGVELDSHYSDLYVPVNPTTTDIVDKYKYKSNVTKFKSQIDGLMYYDIPFAYLPYWESKRK